MTRVGNTFSHLAVGTVPTVANSGGAGGDALSRILHNANATTTIVESPFPEVSRAVRTVSTGATTIFGYDLTASNRNSAYMLFQNLAPNSVSHQIMAFRILTAGAIYNLNFLTSKALQLSPGTSPALADNEIYRIRLATEMAAVPTTTNGKIKFEVTRLSDNSIFFTYEKTDANLGTSQAGEFRFGRSGGAGTSDYIFGNPIYDNDTYDFIEPPLPPKLFPVGVTAGSWTNNGSGLLTAVTDSSDLSYADSPLGPSAFPFDLSLGGIDKPAGNFVFTIRAARIGGTTASLAVTLRNGSTTLATATVAPVLGSAPTDVVATFAAADIAAITQTEWRAGLSVRIIGSAG